MCCTLVFASFLLKNILQRLTCLSYSGELIYTYCSFLFKLTYCSFLFKLVYQTLSDVVVPLYAIVTGANKKDTDGQTVKETITYQLGR